MNCSRCNKEITPSIKKGAPLKEVNHVAITYMIYFPTFEKLNIKKALTVRQL